MIVWLYIIIMVVTLSFVYAGWRAAPYVPMRSNDLARVIKLADIKNNDKFVDLGCGDGKAVIAAAKAGADARGYEISLLPYIMAKISCLCLKNCRRPKIIFKDFWRVNLSDADVIFVFLMPKIMARLQDKIQKEVKPGTKIISYSFPIAGWEPEIIDNVDGRPKIRLYVKK